MRLPLYSQAGHLLILDGLIVSGFGEGDWLTVKVAGGCVVRKEAADGPQLSRIAPQGGQIVISLLPTSPALGKVYAIREDVIAKPRLFSVQLVTGANVISGVGEKVVANRCGFGEMPSFMSGGPTMVPREFVLECGEIKLDTSDVAQMPDSFVGGLITIT